MNKQLFLLFFILIALISCNSPQDPSNNNNNNNNNNNINITSYAGTYKGEATYDTVPSSTPKQEDITLIVNQDSSVSIQTNSKKYDFNNVVKIDDKNYYSMQGSFILSIVFDGNGNVSLDLTIQGSGPDGASEKYKADKLTKVQNNI